MDSEKCLRGQREVVDNILQLHEDMKKSYFFKSCGNATSRRRFEKLNSFSFVGDINGHHLESNQDTVCSCKNVYYTSEFRIDGKKCNIRGIKKLYKELNLLINEVS